jgi:hypothetical protein
MNGMLHVRTAGLYLRAKNRGRREMSHHAMRQRNSLVAEQIAARGVRVHVKGGGDGGCAHSSRVVLLDQTYDVDCQKCNAEEPHFLIDRDGVFLGFKPAVCKCGLPWTFAILVDGKRMYTFYREDNRYA